MSFICIFCRPYSEPNARLNSYNICNLCLLDNSTNIVLRCGHLFFEKCMIKFII